MSYTTGEDPVDIYWLSEYTTHRNQERLVVRRVGGEDVAIPFPVVKRFIATPRWDLLGTVLPAWSDNEKRIILSAMRRWVAEVEERWPKRRAMKRHRVERLKYDPLAIDDTMGESLYGRRDRRNRKG